MKKPACVQELKVHVYNGLFSCTRKYRFNSDWNLLKVNREFKDIHKGKRCFVLGNAPSLNTQDLSVLKNEIVFTANQISRNHQFKELDTNYHFWADPGFFKENTDEGDKELLQVMKNVNVGNNRPICFFPLEAKPFVKRNKLDQDLDVRYFLPGHQLSKRYKNIDFAGIVPGMNTVVQYAVMLAIYMGCTEIYLLGCDCTGIITYIETKTNEQKFEYAYSISQVEAERMKKMLGEYSCEQTFDGWTRIFAGYRMLKQYCDSRNIQLVNSTNGGILDCLPRKKLEDVVK